MTPEGFITPQGQGLQSLDKRVPYFGGIPTLPSAGYSVDAGPVSFIKAIGRDTTAAGAFYWCNDNASLRETCVKFTGVLTLLASVPDSDGDGLTSDEFRPGWAGSAKIGPYRVDMIEARARSMPRLASAPITARNDFSLQEIRDRYSCALTYLSRGIFQQIMPSDCLLKGSAPTAGQLTYGNNIAVSNNAAPLRFLLDDFDWNDPVARQAMINYVQHGLDLAQMVHSGWRTRAANIPIGNGYLAPGGITVGYKSPVVFAAYMVQEPTLTSIARGNYYFESDQVYRSPVDNRVYYGVGIQGTNSYCPDDGSGVEGGIHCYHPSKQMDAGCGGSPKSYQSQVSHSNTYVELWVRILGAQAFWNDAPWLEYYHAWYEGGRAPGHLHYLWASVSPNNGCSNQTRNAYYTTSFAEQMWAAYKGEVQIVVTRPLNSLEAPIQIVP